MDSKIKLKEFKCSQHENEPIKRALNQPYASKLFYCLECMVSTEPSLKSSLVPVESLIESLFNNAKELMDTKLTSEIPDSLTSVLADEETLTSLFTDYIYGEKQKVIQNCKQLEEAIITILHDSRDQLLKQLDIQLTLFKKNFEDYKKKLARQFVVEKKENNLTMESLVGELNECSNTAELETLIHNYLEEIEEIKQIRNYKSKDFRNNVIENLTYLRKKLDEMNRIYPESIFTEESEYETHSDKLLGAVQKFALNMENITNPITPLELMPFNSVILSQVHLPTLKNWIAPTQHQLTLKLLTRAEKDGSNFKMIAEGINNIANIVILLKTNKNQVLGCYKYSQMDITKRKTDNTSLSFNLTLKSFKEGAELGQLGDGYYELSQYLYLTPNRPIGLNDDLYNQLEGSEIKLNPRNYVCLCLNYLDSKEGPKPDMVQEDLRSILYGVEELEVFEVLN